MEFGSYELLGRLATGGYAHIFLAGERGRSGFERLVCLKTLVPERAADEGFVKDFLAEAELASHLSHPNCVNIYALGRAEGTFYISMEFIAGETLSSLLQTWRPHDPLPTEPMVSIIAAACDGLHYAHELRAPDGHPYNLVHRDVSPQNIMVSYRGQTKVVDFGVAKAAMEREDTRTGIIKGKVRYMSPEQISFGALDRRSDIFSLGLVLFECLTGRQVFDGCSPPEVQYRLVNKPLPKLREMVPFIDSQLEEICSRALAYQASERYATAARMGADLRAYLERVGYSPGPDPVAEMLEERFGARAAMRSAMVARILANEVSPLEIRNTFGARQVMALDIFGEEEHSVEISDVFDDATIMDPQSERSQDISTLDDAEPPTAPTLNHARRRLTSDLMRMDSTGARMKPISALPLTFDDASSPDHPSFDEEPDDTRLLDVEKQRRATSKPEDTKKVDPRNLERRGTNAFAIWIFGFGVGVAVGVALAMYLLKPV